MPPIIIELAPLEKAKKAQLVKEVTELVTKASGLPHRQFLYSCLVRKAQK